MLGQTSEHVRVNAIQRLPLFRAFQTHFILQHLTEILLSPFCCDPCALELTKLCYRQILPSTMICHINKMYQPLYFITTF